MPIANPAYAKYYSTHKDALLNKMKAKYDEEGKEKKKAYWIENQEVLKEKMLVRHHAKKNAERKNKLEDCLNQNYPDAVKTEIRTVIESNDFSAVNKRYFDNLEKKLIVEV